MEIKASAKFVKTTPDKARILVNLVKGKTCQTAIEQLTFCGRDAGKFIILVIKQAMDQVKSKDLDIEDFKIKSFLVNEGPKLKRRRIRHQGRSTAILKRMAHIIIVLSDDKGKIESPKKLAKAKVKSEIKPVAENPTEIKEEIMPKKIAKTKTKGSK